MVLLQLQIKCIRIPLEKTTKSIQASRAKTDPYFHLKDRRIREKVKVRSFEVVKNIKAEIHSCLYKTFVDGNFS